MKDYKALYKEQRNINKDLRARLVLLEDTFSDLDVYLSNHPTVMAKNVCDDYKNMHKSAKVCKGDRNDK